MTNTVVFTGYLAELITLQAERKNLTPEDYIRSFFPEGAMHRKPESKTLKGEENLFIKSGAMHPRK